MGNVTFPLAIDSRERYVAGMSFKPFHRSSRHLYFMGRLFGHRHFGNFHNTDCVVKAKREFCPMSDAFWDLEMAVRRNTKDVLNRFLREHKHVKIRLEKFSPVEIDKTLRAAFSLLTGTRQIREYEWVLVSPYIEDVTNLTQKKRHEIKELEALSHFSWHITNGDLLLTDFKGTFKYDGYSLLLPTIHSSTRTFGIKDSGHDGMQSFFTGHICSELCQSYRRPVYHQSPSPDTRNSACTDIRFDDVRL